MSGLLQKLLYERALLLDAVETGLVLLVALGLDLSGDNQNAIVAVVIAVLAFAKGLLTTPFAVTLLTDLARAVLVLAVGFGLDMPPDRIAVIVTFIGTFATLVQRIQVSPTPARRTVAAHATPPGTTQPPGDVMGPRG